MAIGIGLDVGGTKILGCAIEEDGERVGELRVPSPRAAPDLVAALLLCTEQLLGALGSRAGEVSGVGVGLPGLVDRKGVVHEAANLPGAQELDLPAAMLPRLAEVLGPQEVGAEERWRLVVDNDATCATAAEHAYGAGRGSQDCILVTLGTGIGGGIVADGRMVRGERNFAGEVGHAVVDPSGPLCGCGRHGCWERFASGTGLAYLGRLAVERGEAPVLLALAGGDPAAVRSEHVEAAAIEKDPGALAAVEEFGRYLALGLANIAEILDPGRIILGGGLVAGGEVLFGPGLASYAATRRGSGPREVPVVFAELGERAGAYGAAALAMGVVR